MDLYGTLTLLVQMNKLFNKCPSESGVRCSRCGILGHLRFGHCLGGASCPHHDAGHANAR